VLILHTPLLENLRHRARGGPVGIEGRRDAGTEARGEEARTFRTIGGRGATKRRSDEGWVRIGGDWWVLVVFVRSELDVQTFPRAYGRGC
jgi:hypothetical protein